MIHAEQQEEDKDGSDDESESEQEDVDEETPAMEIQMEHSEQLVDRIVERAEIAEQNAPICSSAVAVPVDFVPEVEKVDEAEVEKVEEAENEMVVEHEEESPVPAVMEPEKPVGQLVG